MLKYNQFQKRGTLWGTLLFNLPVFHLIPKMQKTASNTFLSPFLVKCDKIKKGAF
jgi:hypothetical protein